MDMKRFFLYAIAIAALALAGCGGGGNGVTPPVTPDPDSPVVMPMPMPDDPEPDDQPRIMGLTMAIADPDGDGKFPEDNELTAGRPSAAMMFERGGKTTVDGDELGKNDVNIRTPKNLTRSWRIGPTFQIFRPPSSPGPKTKGTIPSPSIAMSMRIKVSPLMRTMGRSIAWWEPGLQAIPVSPWKEAMRRRTTPREERPPITPLPLPAPQI